MPTTNQYIRPLYLIRRYLRSRIEHEIVASGEQSKNWRKKQEWYTNGKRNECERYQRHWLTVITGVQCSTTNLRINLRTGKLSSISNPLKTTDGFDWSENFDGLYTWRGTKYYVNFKFVCDSGGAQLRTLREVYWFINGQLNHLKDDSDTVKFINILDGDYSRRMLDKFKYLVGDNQNVFVGDLYSFKKWWDSEKVRNLSI